MKHVRRILVVPLLVGAGALALASFRASDDEPPPECPLCGGDPALHAKRLADVEILRFELAFAGLMQRR
jgi:hypothetical protein